MQSERRLRAEPKRPKFKKHKMILKALARAKRSEQRPKILGTERSERSVLKNKEQNEARSMALRS